MGAPGVLPPRPFGSLCVRRVAQRPPVVAAGRGLRWDRRPQAPVGPGQPRGKLVGAVGVTARDAHRPVDADVQERDRPLAGLLRAQRRMLGVIAFAFRPREHMPGVEDDRLAMLAGRPPQPVCAAGLRPVGVTLTTRAGHSDSRACPVMWCSSIHMSGIGRPGGTLKPSEETYFGF